MNCTTRLHSLQGHFRHMPPPTTQLSTRTLLMSGKSLPKRLTLTEMPRPQSPSQPFSFPPTPEHATEMLLKNTQVIFPKVTEHYSGGTTTARVVLVPGSSVI